MLLTIRENNIDQRAIDAVVKVLNNDGVIIIPTDTVYGIACNYKSKKAIEKICLFKNIKPEKAVFTFLFSNLSTLSMYAKSIDTPTFRLLKQHIPGPFTFILPASNQAIKSIGDHRKTIGMRVPNNKIVQQIIETLGAPLFSTSLHHPNDELMEYLTEPDEIYEQFERMADLVIDGGIGGLVPSTVVDCTSDAPEIIRQGAGELLA